MPVTRPAVTPSPVFPPPVPLLPVRTSVMPVFPIGSRRAGMTPIRLRAVAELVMARMRPVLPARLGIPVVAEFQGGRHDDRSRRRIGRRLVLRVGGIGVRPAVVRSGIGIRVRVNPIGIVVIATRCVSSDRSRVACIYGTVEVIRHRHAARQKDGWTKKNEKAFHDSTRQNRPR